MLSVCFLCCAELLEEHAGRGPEFSSGFIESERLQKYESYFPEAFLQIVFPQTCRNSDRRGFFLNESRLLSFMQTLKFAICVYILLHIWELPTR